MEKLIIKPEAAYYAYYFEAEDRWIEKDLIDSELPISWYVDMPVEIIGKVSIRRIFELFERYDDQLTFMYAKALKTLDFNDLLTILESGESSNNIPVKSICLVWAGEIIEQGEDADDFIAISYAIVGLDTEDDDADIDDDGVFQLTNFDFIQWASVPVYLDNYLDFTKGRDENIIVGGIYSWKFGDFLECILSEISLNLFLSGQVSNPDIVIKQHSPTMNVRELFKYLEELENFSKDY